MDSFGLSEIVIRTGIILFGLEQEAMVVIAFNESGNRIRGLTASPTQGSLPNINVLRA